MFVWQILYFGSLWQFMFSNFFEILSQKVYRQIVDARVLVTLVLLEEQTVNQETGLGKLTSITNSTEETLAVIAEERWSMINGSWQLLIASKMILSNQDIGLDWVEILFIVMLSW